jgi:hypothetical protein
MPYNFYNLKIKQAGGSILHTPRSLYNQEIKKPGDGRPFNMELIPEAYTPLGAIFDDDCSSGPIADRWDISHVLGGNDGSPLYTGGVLRLGVVGSDSSSYGVNVHTISNWPPVGEFSLAFDYKQYNNWAYDDLIRSEASVEIVQANPEHCDLATCYRQMEESQVGPPISPYGVDSKLMLRLRTTGQNTIHVAQRIDGVVTELFNEAFTYTSGSFDSIKFIVNLTNLWFEVWNNSGVPSIVGSRTSFSSDLMSFLENYNICVNFHFHNRLSARYVDFDNFDFDHS